jgi:beta-xylosidase
MKFDKCQYWFMRTSAGGVLRMAALAVCGLSLALTSVHGEGAEMYKNPVIPGDHPDPSVIRVGRDYWATATSGDWGPEFPLLHSRDLVNWELKGAVFYHRPEWAVGNFWAPEITRFKDRYHVYYAARKCGGPLTVAVATADKPGGPYTDQGPLVAQEDGSIDPALVFDESGKPYLIWKEDGNSREKPTPIWAQPLDDSGTRVTGRPVELIRNDADWEGPLVEGPYILRRGDWFYLFYSGNGCCGGDCNYALGVARSHKLLGPWEKDPVNPILSANETWKCPGHGSIVTDRHGRDWLLYHAYSTGGSAFTGREAMLDEVTFGGDNWPVINHAHGPSVEAASPSGEIQKQVDISFLDKFSGHTLQAGWQWPQNREPRYELDDDHLLLFAPPHSTNLLGAVFARATPISDYEATTVVDVESLKPGSAVGLCAFGDAANAAGIMILDGHLAAWRLDEGKTDQTTQLAMVKEQTIMLRLTARHGHRFEMSASADGKSWLTIGKALDDKRMPAADRSLRVALTVGEGDSAVGQFNSFSITPISP